MKKLLILFPIIFLTACFDDVPECWDSAAKKLVINITKEKGRLKNTPTIQNILEESVDKNTGIRVCSAELIKNRLLQPSKIYYTVQSKRGETGEYVYVEVAPGF